MALGLPALRCSRPAGAPGARRGQPARASRGALSRRAPIPASRRLVPIRATPGGPESEEDDEARLEALEASTRGKKGAIAAEAAPKEEESSTAMSQWKEGQLLPDNWDKLDAGQKAYELYAGKRGLLFWSNRLALGAVVVMGVLWILFRFVGPLLGLYELKSTFSDVQY